MQLSIQVVLSKFKFKKVDQQFLNFLIEHSYLISVDTYLQQTSSKNQKLNKQIKRNPKNSKNKMKRKY